MTRLQVDAPPIAPSAADLVGQQYPLVTELLRTILQRLDKIEALIAERPKRDATDEEEREWPPDPVDLRDPYWEFCRFSEAVKTIKNGVNIGGPYAKTKLNTLRHDVSVQFRGGVRWYSMRRLWECAKIDPAD